MDSEVIEKQFVPQYSTLVEQITEFLSVAIIEGQFKQGERLVENELQNKFGISRGPIREAFRILEMNGLLLNLPRKGTFVRNINQKDIDESYIVRAHLESLAVRLAASHFGKEDIEKMELSYSKMVQAANENSFKAYYKYHNEYHRVFINASKNETLIRMLENLTRQTIWFLYSCPPAYFGHLSEYSIRVHREILDLFIAKDIAQLEDLVKTHILIFRDQVLQLLRKKSGDSEES